LETLQVLLTILTHLLLQGQELKSW